MKGRERGRRVRLGERRNKQRKDCGLKISDIESKINTQTYNIERDY